MNILYLCDEYPPCQHGGIGSATQLLARTLALKGHNVYVAGFYPYYRVADKNQNDQGIKVFRFFYGSKLQLQFSKRNFFGKFVNISGQFNKYLAFLKTIIEENAIEIIETPDFVEAFRYSGPLMIKFPDFGVPLVVKLHSSYTVYNAQNNLGSGNKKIFLKEKILLDSAQGIVGVSDSIRKRAKEVFIGIDNIEVLYNGIKLDSNIEYNTASDNNTVVFAGSLVEQKGIFNLLKAWSRVIEIVASARLFLYGKSSVKAELEIRSYLKAFPRNSVEIKGFVSKELLSGIYSEASCAIFPSFQEAFSMAPMEAMAVGCPVIYTKRTSGPELITNGVDGILVDPENIQEIADAIVFILRNREKAIKLGQKGYLKIKDNFDISLIANRHLKYYQHIIDKS